MNSKFHDGLMMNNNAFSVGNYHLAATTNLIIYVDAQCQSLTLLGTVSNWTWNSVLHCLVTETDTHNHPQVRTLFRASSGTTHICAHLMRLGLLLHNKQIIECAFEGTYNSCRVKLWLPPGVHRSTSIYTLIIWMRIYLKPKRSCCSSRMQ